MLTVNFSRRVAPQSGQVSSTSFPASSPAPLNPHIALASAIAISSSARVGNLAIMTFQDGDGLVGVGPRHTDFGVGADPGVAVGTDRAVIEIIEHHVRLYAKA